MDRLVSTYEDKIIGDSQYKPNLKWYIIKRYGHRMISRTKGRHHQTLFQDRPIKDVHLVGDDSNQIEFVEFLQYVVESFFSTQLIPDVHTLSTTRLCRPCSLKYDYIAKLETIEQDFNNIILRLSNSSDQHQMVFPKYNVKATFRSNLENESKKFKPLDIQDYYRSVPINIIDKIRSIYGDDMKIFSYSWRNKWHKI
ncbi:hypothetical protein LSH36_10g02025 [Paralvinella palmiformis]|uniref:Carbohydrate sulfotransferase n=1 Tax=Paralvinella palmiformis TaxID=53620 RepID=A0AAD9KF74_9ANNE|nr:hypothetical protein LSH36_10g02025 [Paralvinella palmiformis]